VKVGATKLGWANQATGSKMQMGLVALWPVTVWVCVCEMGLMVAAWVVRWSRVGSGKMGLSRLSISLYLESQLLSTL